MFKIIFIYIFLISGLFASNVVNLNTPLQIKNGNEIKERTTKKRTKAKERTQNDNKEKIELPKKVSKEKE